MIHTSLKYIISISLFYAHSVYGQNVLKPLEIAIGEWRPIVSSESKGYGPTSELVSVILQRMGYQANIRFVPWGHAENSVKQNEKNQGIRASFPFLKTSKRSSNFLFSQQPIFSSCMVFFYHKDKIPPHQTKILRSIKDLKQLNIGFVSEGGGYQYPVELSNILKKNGKDFNHLYEVFEQLINTNNQDVQIVPTLAEIGNELLINLFPSDRFKIAIFDDYESKKNEPCLLPVDYYFMMGRRNPNNAEFMRRFNETHRNIDIETLARIRQRYLEQPSSSRPAIRLQLTPKTEKIIAKNQQNQEVILPRGTKGLLTDWQIVKDQQYSKVFITSGPYRGKHVFVNKKHIVLKGKQ